MKGPNKGKGLVLSPHDYHCKHARAAWFDETWREVQANMCLGRRDDERTRTAQSSRTAAELKGSVGGGADDNLLLYTVQV